VVRCLCEEQEVPVNSVPPEKIAEAPDFGDVTPLMLALENDHEDIALYLLSLGDEDPRSLNLEWRTVRNTSSLLTLAVRAGMVRVVEALLGHGVNLLARDAQGQLAVADLFAD